MKYYIEIFMTINYCCCFINLSNILLMIDQSFWVVHKFNKRCTRRVLNIEIVIINIDIYQKYSYNFAKYLQPQKDTRYQKEIKVGWNVSSFNTIILCIPHKKCKINHRKIDIISNYFLLASSSSALARMILMSISG